MKKTFTILIAAIAVILMMAQPVKVVGQTKGTASTTYVFTSSKWKANIGTTAADWTSKKDGAGFTSGRGVQVTKNGASACANSPSSFSSITGVKVKYCTNASAGAGDISIYVTTSSGNAQSGTQVGSTFDASYTSGTGTDLKETTFTPSTALTGYVQVYATCSTNSIYIYSVEVEYTTDPTQLAAPTNFSATAGNNQATFSWTAVDHANSYTIIRKIGSTWTAENDTVELFKNVNLDNNGQFIGTGLANSSEYVCKVRANGDGTNYSNSALSDATATFTPTAAQQYTVSIADGITGGTAGANPTTATAGTEISLTKTPTAGYGFTSWNVYKTGDPNTTVTVTNDKFNMPAYAVTVSATFTPYTVTLSANGSTSTWNVTMNNGNIPDASAPCAAWSFYKWSTSAVASQTTTAPTSTVNATGYKPTGDITLYAVYKKTEGGNSSTNSTVTLSNGVFTDATSNDPAYITWTEDYITILQEKGTNSNATAVANYTTNPRWYQYHVITLTPIVTVNSIAITQYNSKYGLEDQNTTFTNCSTSVSNHVVTITPTNGNQDVVITMGAQARISGISVNHVVTTTYYHSTPDCMETVENPQFSPAGGNYTSTQNVTLSCEIPDATISYKLTENGEWLTYSAAISVSTTTTIWAKATKEGMHESEVVSATYTIQHDVAEPTLPESQVFTTNTYPVEITVPANTTVYYTTNGDNPTNASTQYSTAFTIDATKTVKAIAYDGDGCASDVVSATYTRAYTLADAKALYDDEDVENITINLAGVQIAAQSGKYAYAQQGNVGLLIYGTTSQTFTAGDNITSGTVTGTITKYNENMELSIATDTYSSIVKTAGALTASATGVTIPNITSSFSTYESRYIALTSLTMSVSGKTLTDTDSHTLAIYDPFNVLNEAIQPDHNVIVNGVITSNTKNSTTTYQIIPLAKSGISTGVAATLPTLDPVGGETDGEALETETVTITPATGTTVTYAFGEDYDEIDSETELTVPSTNATALELVVNRDFYTENTATYYYKTSATTYDVSFYVNGDEDTSLAKEVLEGSAIGVLPTPTAPSGYTFRGWAQAEISGVQNNAPTVVTSATTVNAAMDLYAVFAIETESTTNENLTYSLDKDDFATGSYTSNDGEKTIKGVKLQIKDVYQNSSSIQIKASTGAFYNKEALGIKVTSVVIDVKTNTIKVFEGSKTDQFTEVTSSGSGSEKTYTFSTQNDNPYFKITATSSYAQANTITVNYVALVNVLSYSNYCTTVSVPSPEALPIDANGNLTGNATIPTGAAYTLTTPVKVGTGKTFTVSNNAVFANADPANLIIEDGGQLILANTNTNVKATVQKSIKAAGAQSSKVGEAPYGWYSISSSVNNASLEDNTNLITQDEAPYKFDLYRYNETVDAEQWENYHANDDFTHMTNGRGYLYRNEEDITVEFTGTVNTGNVKYTVTKSDVGALSGFNLIGNPYTHDIYKGTGGAINDSKLNEGFYVATNSGSWTACTDNTTPIEKNQGILVQANTDGETEITITNVITGGPSAKANHDNIKFMVSNSQYEDVAYAMFDKGNGLNKISHRNAEVPMLYIPQDDENYAIAMMSDDTQSFGLNFKAMTMGKYTLSYKADGQFSYLHVIDRLTGEDVDMLLEESYSFVGTPKDAENRFIVKLNYQSGLDSSDNSTFAYQSGNDIIVSGEGTLQIFDVMGRMIATQNINGVETVNVPANGVYVFRLNEKVQKVVVK